MVKPPNIKYMLFSSTVELYEVGTKPEIHAATAFQGEIYKFLGNLPWNKVSPEELGQSYVTVIKIDGVEYYMLGKHNEHDIVEDKLEVLFYKLSAEITYHQTNYITITLRNILSNE